MSAPNSFLTRATSISTRNRASSQASLLSRSSTISSRQRAVSSGNITGDTFTLLRDALRLQKNLDKTITSFKLSRGLCKELTAQIELCDEFVNELLSTYESKKAVLESQGYFVAVMEYVEVLNKASEFVLLLKDKGAITRFKNRDRYRKATRVLALEVGKAVHHLQRLLATVCPNESHNSTLIDNPVQTMATITGTLKLLRNRVFCEGENLMDHPTKEEPEILASKDYRIQRRQIRRLLDHAPRLGNGFVVYKANFDGIIVAEKVFKDISAGFLREIQQEISRWLQVRSFSRVAWIHGLWVEGSSLGVVSEYFDNGNLQQLLSKLNDTDSKLEVVHQTKFSSDIIEVVNDLHQRNLPLGGIHPREIFLNQEYSLYIANIESLFHRSSGSQKEEYLVFTPPEYRQPEFNQIPTLPGDIFSLGVILMCIWCTRIPDIEEIAIGEPSTSIAWPENMPSDLSSLVERCLSSDTASRPTISELLATLQRTAPAAVPNTNDSSPDLTAELSNDLTMLTRLSFSPNSEYDTIDTMSSTLLENIKNLTFSTPKSGQSPKLGPYTPSVNDDELSHPGLRKNSVLTLDSFATSVASRATEDETPAHIGISLKEALALYSAEEYEKAYSYFMYLSEVEGSPAAKYYLGVYHYSGKTGFLPQDVPKALDYLQRAAQDDYGDALDLLGLHHLDATFGTPDFEKAFEYFQRAASLLSPAGCYHLSLCHQNGHGTTQDDNLALYALQLSASLGYGPAVAMLEEELVPASDPVPDL